ncbi:hypothetical protein KXR64_21245 [Brucella intermedia]|uniref:hypothetical protein n=1 Tax=Brucella TaxID=234 RepID=UPI0009462167|nr:hypothetical protein [Brucella intermedia]
MEETYDFIKDLVVVEREEIFIDIARALEQTAGDAFIEGHGQFAVMLTSMAEAIRIKLARDDLHNAERVLQPAAALIAKFKAVHPYPLVSKSVH